MLARLRRPTGDDHGISLVELLVTTFLLGVVSILTVSATTSTHKMFAVSDDESRGLADLRTVTERLDRDLRAARGVDPSSNQSQLTLWIDYNSDYKQQANETVTWKLVLDPTDPSHYDVARAVQGGTQVVEGRTLVSQIAFSYDVAPPNTRQVSVQMTYDAMLARGTGLRTANFQDRLRNVP
jgi:Tfp pilus assembly protein PilW